MTALRDALRQKWRLYLFEGLGLAVFMIGAGLFATALFYPGSALSTTFAPPAKYALLGLLMFPVIAFGIVGAPWGKATGAHVNPVVTLAFLRLGKISRADALLYIVGQFLGAYVGVAVVALLWKKGYSDPAVHYGSTVPGPDGPIVALAIEFAMTLVLMLVILALESEKRLKPYAPYAVAGLLAFYLATATPFTGMSLNPARTMGSATYSLVFDHIWLYFAGPLAGALLGAELFLRLFPARLEGIAFPPES